MLSASGSPALSQFSSQSETIARVRQHGERWLGVALARDEDPNEILTYDERNESLTPQVVLEAAQTYLPSSEPDLVSKLLPAEEG